MDPPGLLAQGSAADESQWTAATMHAAEVPVRRWNPWSTVLPVALTAGVYAVERLLGMDPSNALVDGILAGFLCFVILAYWKR